MTSNQQYKLQMYWTVFSVCSEEEEIISRIPAFLALIATLKQQIGLLEELEKIQVSPTQGITKQKEKHKEDLLVSILELACAMHAFAVSGNNFELKQKTAFTTSVKALHQSELLNISEMLQVEAGKHIGSLKEYGIEVSNIQLLKTRTEQFRQNITKPSEARIDRTGATAHIKETFAKTDSLLRDQIEKLALRYKISDPRFYHAYTAARNIVDRKAKGGNGTDTITNKVKEA